MKKRDLRRWNKKYVAAVEGAAGVRAGEHTRLAWGEAMEKIMRDPVKFYLNRIWYHNDRIRAHQEKIEHHKLKIQRLTKLIKQIERKQQRK